MSNYNKVVLLGHLTRDPELRYTAAGHAVAKLGLAINHKWRDKEGQLKESVCYVNVSSFGSSAETSAKFLKKGSALLVDGRLNWSQWETEKGEKRSAVDVVAERIHFIPRGSGTGPTASGPASSAQRGSLKMRLRDDGSAEPYHAGEGEEEGALDLVELEGGEDAAPAVMN